MKRGKRKRENFSFFVVVAAAGGPAVASNAPSFIFSRPAPFSLPPLPPPNGPAREFCDPFAGKILFFLRQERGNQSQIPILLLLPPPWIDLVVVVICRRRRIFVRRRRRRLPFFPALPL